MLQLSTTQVTPLKSNEYTSVPAKGPLMDRVFSMRYKSYCAENYIDKNHSEKFMDDYDAMPNSSSYLVYRESKAIASIRVCTFDPDRKIDIPAMEVFYDEISQVIGYDNKIAEINKFVVDPSFQKKGGLRARFQLFRALADQPIYDDTDFVVMAVRPAHVKFYKKMFDCETISTLKDYKGLKFSTVLLLLRDIQKARDLVIKKTDETIVSHESIPNYSAS